MNKIVACVPNRKTNSPKMLDEIWAKDIGLAICGKGLLTVVFIMSTESQFGNSTLKKVIPTNKNLGCAYFVDQGKNIIICGEGRVRVWGFLLMYPCLDSIDHSFNHLGRGQVRTEKGANSFGTKLIFVGCSQMALKNKFKVLMKTLASLAELIIWIFLVYKLLIGKP